MKRDGKAQVFICALMILPAVALGTAAMICGDVSPLLWGQQAAAWTILALLTGLLHRTAMRISAEVLSAFFLIFLAVTLLGQEAGGARRWVNLIVFHVNAAHLILPALIAVSHSLKKPWIALLSAALILSFQPDFSQLTALCAAGILVLFFCATLMNYWSADEYVEQDMNRFWSSTASDEFLHEFFESDEKNTTELHRNAFELLGKIRQFLAIHVMCLKP